MKLLQTETLQAAKEKLLEYMKEKQDTFVTELMDSEDRYWLKIS